MSLIKIVTKSFFKSLMPSKAKQRPLIVSLILIPISVIFISVIIDFKMNSKQVAEELQKYVINRESNVVTQNSENWNLDKIKKVKFVLALSSDEVDKKYTDQLQNIYNKSQFVSRNVHVTDHSCNLLFFSGCHFDFKTIDTYQNGEVKENKLIAFITFYQFRPSERKILSLKYLLGKEINPLGLMVRSYTVESDLRRDYHRHIIKK
jgi:type IV secretory pathway component VirB8